MFSPEQKTQFLLIFSYIFCAVFVIVFPFAIMKSFTFGLLLGLLAGTVVGIIVTPFIMFGISIFSNFGGKLFYTGSPSTISDHEMILSELEQIKILFDRREYQEALKQIKLFNREHPNIPEALYLKAQIRWDGFQDKIRAISSLEKTIKYSDPGSIYNTWAKKLLAELESYGDDDVKNEG